MHIHEIFSRHKTTFSFEFMPPKSDSEAEALTQTVQKLEALKPTFVSVTYGAGGSTRQRTHDLVVRLKHETTCDPVPHLTCVCHSAAEIEAILTRYAQQGISNLMALGGDIPRSRPGYDRSEDAYRYGSELVKAIVEFNQRGIHPHPLGFGIGVAGYPDGHPATPNKLKEMDYLKAKVDEGAHYIVTQLFFDNRSFYDFRDRCELAGIHVPIIAGIMPVLSEQSMISMANMALGVRYPAGFIKAIRRCGGDEPFERRVGIQWATEQCRDLLDNHVAGIHFYTFNRSKATSEIYANLGVKDSLGLTEPTLTR